MRTCSLFATFVLLSASAVGSNGEDKLLSVVTLYRHGDRTPVDSYPTDPYNASFWKIGYGQLTNKGKTRAFELGKWLRTRYAGFLPADYNVKDIYVRSSDVDRTLMTAESCLAGLYPPKGDQVWNKLIHWQPLPIHTTPMTEDSLLYFFNCDELVELTEKTLGLDVFQNLLEQNQELLQYVAENSGTNISTIMDALSVFDILRAEKYNGLELPEWTADPVFDTLENLSVYGMLSYSWTREQQRLIAGPLLSTLVDFFNNTIAGGSDTQKMLMFSAHDLNIANVLNTLHKFDWRLPPYCATLIFELVASGNTNYVDITYKTGNVTNSIVLDNCDTRCTFEQFVESIQDILLTNEQYEAECNTVKKVPNIFQKWGNIKINFPYIRNISALKLLL